MSLNELASFTQKVADAADTIVGNPVEAKAIFDAAPEELRVAFNNVVKGLKSTAIGDSGAKNIGISAIEGVEGSDIETVLKNWTKNIPHLHIEMTTTDYLVNANTDTPLNQTNFSRYAQNGGWSDNTDKWVVPTDGVYDITTYLVFANLTVGSETKVKLYQYDAGNVLLNAYTLGGTVASTDYRWNYLNGSINLKLLKGQKIALVAYHSNTPNALLKEARLTALWGGKY